MRETLLNTICQLTWIAAAAVLSGCGEGPNSSQPPRSPAEVIRECIENSGPKLDEALAAGNVNSAVGEIVQVLDDYEDFEEINPFEEFHRGMEQLQGAAAKGASNDDLKAKIKELKELAALLLSENRK